MEETKNLTKKKNLTFD